MATSDARADIHDETRKWITEWCKVLKPEHIDWTSASLPDPKYNCMGFAVGVFEWWEPPQVNEGVLMNPGRRWFNQEPVEGTIEDFVRAAETEGFQTCASAEWEDEYEKIVLYYRDDQTRWFMHAAVLVGPPDRWKSKMAEHSDFEHPPNAFDDVWYWLPKGRVYMKRTKQAQ